MTSILGFPPPQELLKTCAFPLSGRQAQFIAVAISALVAAPAGLLMGFGMFGKILIGIICELGATPFIPISLSCVADIIPAQASPCPLEGSFKGTPPVLLPPAVNPASTLPSKSS
ncbi:MAG: hypothetical protein GYB55_08030 [Cytophagales bacterium]|nr:hypothetical protein [Cytophagales bacterium]